MPDQNQHTRQDGNRNVYGDVLQVSGRRRRVAVLYFADGWLCLVSHTKTDKDDVQPGAMSIQRNGGNHVS
jgi:hypothetical protein